MTNAAVILYKHILVYEEAIMEVGADRIILYNKEFGIEHIIFLPFDYWYSHSK